MARRYSARTARDREPVFGSCVASTYTLSALEYGSGLNRTASAMLKIAAFAPMASVSVSTATDVNIGAWRSRRSASLKSCSMREFYVGLGQAVRRNCALLFPTNEGKRRVHRRRERAVGWCELRAHVRSS